MPSRFEVIGLVGLPEFKQGDDLVGEILRVAERMNVGVRDGDVFVVSQKIVSKVEGRLVNLADVAPSELARKVALLCEKDARFVELVLRESRSVEYVAPGHLIVTTKRGITCANAGIDVSNVMGDPEWVLLLPEDPDASAKRIRLEIERRAGKSVGVIICDTHGRTLREGQVNVSIGSSGILPFRDYRGVNDSKGYLLRVKQIAAADEVAGAAELVIGQAQERIPVAVVRGLEVASGDASSSELNMPKEKWFFKPDKAHTIDMESIRR